jgi:CarD family transcriptional regulator
MLIQSNGLACHATRSQAVVAVFRSDRSIADEERMPMAYQVGDTVVYPHHGAAVIERQETRTMEGKERDYLVLRLTYGDLTLMVPADATDEVGLRDVCSKSEVDAVWDVLRNREFSMPTNWSRRFKANYEKLKSGDIFQVAEVVRNLAIREQDKGLSTGEKQMYTRAKKILASELMYALEKTEDEAEAYLDHVLTRENLAASA